MKSIFGVMFLVAVLAFGGYILKPSKPCQRIEHASLPVELFVKAVSYIAEPWVEKETHLTVIKWGLKARLWTVRYLQKQFWDKDNLTCPWSDESLDVRVEIPDMPSNQPDYAPANLPAPQKQ